MTPAAAGELGTAPARIQAALAAVRRAHPGLTAAETGDISAGTAQNRVVNGSLNRVGLLAIPVTLVVLVLAFGSLVAALVPLLLGDQRPEREHQHHQGDRDGQQPDPV